MSLSTFIKNAIVWGVARLSRDSNGNVTGIDGAINLSKTSVTPYRCAFWGDSRYNSFIGSGAECIGSATFFSPFRAPTWAIAHMQDADYSRSYTVSGDSAALWNLASRSGGKTYIDLNKSDVDVVFIQYGVNDCVAGTAAATTVANLKALISEIVKGGKFVVFESIMPVNSPVANYAAVQALIDSVNASMQSWLANFSLIAIYVDTTTLFKDSNGYANMSNGYYAIDGIHPSKLGAYYAGKALASAVRALLPKRIGYYFGSDNSEVNYINQISPSPITSAFYFVESGSATVVQTTGQDSNGYYYDWAITPTSLNGDGEFKVRCDMTSNFQTSSPPYQVLNGNEVLKGSARIICDDGNGGAPNAYNIVARQRFYTGSIYCDWSGLTLPSADPYNFPEKIDIRAVTPKMNNLTASVVANPAVQSGFAFIVFVEGNAITAPVRVRVYNPQIRIVGYVKSAVLTAAAFALPISASAYTNRSNGNQQVTVGGGTVSAIAVNGAATGLTSGTFILSPGDTLTPTYTVAPTWTVKQI